jgi:hypothetical protein
LYSGSGANKMRLSFLVYRQNALPGWINHPSPNLWKMSDTETTFSAYGATACDYHP